MEFGVERSDELGVFRFVSFFRGRGGGEVGLFEGNRFVEYVLEIVLGDFVLFRVF